MKIAQALGQNDCDKIFSTILAVDFVIKIKRNLITFSLRFFKILLSIKYNFYFLEAFRLTLIWKKKLRENEYATFSNF